MFKYFWKYLSLFLAIIVVILLLKPKPTPIIVRPNITPIPSSPIQYPIVSYVPLITQTIKTNTIYDTIHGQIPVNIDSLKIVEDYFLKRIYNDTLISDTNLTAIVIDTVSKNRIVGRSKVIKVYPHLYKQVIIESPRRKIFLGLGVYRMQTIGLTAGIAYEDRKERLYDVEYDPFAKVGLISMKWKLTLRRQR